MSANKRLVNKRDILHAVRTAEFPLSLDLMWLAEHRRWAQEHPGTRQVVDTIHGHYLQREAPALMIDAIWAITRESR